MRKAAQKRPTIGVLSGSQIYDRTTPGNFVGPLLRGVYMAAQDRQCNLLLACGMESSSTSIRPAWPLPSLDVDFVPVGPWNTDGLIVIAPLFSQARSQYIQELVSSGHPLVFANVGENGPTVAVDNENGIRQALAHLIEHGHQRIAFITRYPDDMEGEGLVRLNTFQAIAREYGLASDQNLIAYAGNDISSGQQAMCQILNSGIAFTGVLACNSQSAMGAMQALSAAGLRIPQDVAIIAVENSFDVMTHTSALTTLHSSPFRIGYQALELLLDSIEGRGKKLDHVSVPMQLVIRESCGCQPGATPQFVFKDFKQPVSRQDQHAVTTRLAQMMAETVLAGAQRLRLDEVRVRCGHLVESFIESLDHNDPTIFHVAVEGTLAHVEEIEDDMHVWQAGLLTLQKSLGLIREMMEWPGTNQQPEEMLREARIMIIQSIQGQYRRSIANQKWIADQIDQLNAHLFAALDEAQVYEILASCLSQLGIQHAGVAFFVAEGNDPMAWSWLRKVLRHAGAENEDVELHFPSRQFPPAGLYAEPYRLILLPIADREELSGFVAFDADNLEICAKIVWQLVLFLKVVRLYQGATNGRRLAEEANRMKSRFLSTVSHELRTPLNLIVGLSELLLQEDASGSASLLSSHRQDLETIYASAEHLGRLIRDVLDLATSQAGQLQLELEPLDLMAVFKAATEIGQELARQKNLDWKMSIPPSLPAVIGDRTRLRQVLLNLISNAVKFTEHGQVELRIEAHETELLVSISDTGLGIAPREQEFIFDEFRQSERTTARGYGGLGLGLAISKRLIELHGGRIWVESSGREGSGSSFYFSLPIMESDAVPDNLKTIPLNQTVLLLAEQSGNGERLYEYLTRQGFDIKLIWIDAGADWPSRLLKPSPGAVILDDGVATKYGWAILKVLKENPLTQDVPVWFYSLNEEQDSGSMLELSYLTKPMNKTELTRVLDRQGLKEGADQRKITILVVDDDPASLEMHARIVAMWSAECRILKASNGREALILIQETHPDLVLLDLMMPELDGFGVLEAMQSDERSRDIPVLVLTGQSLTLEDMAKFNSGVTNILKKGLFSVEETLSHVATALTRGETPGEGIQRVVRKAMTYLDKHYMETISLKDVALYVGVSKEYLARCFHQEMGITLVIYLNRYRVNRAKALLERGEQSLTEIALEVGFSSSTYFSRVFRQEVGISPSEYERVHKQTRP